MILRIPKKTDSDILHSIHARRGHPMTLEMQNALEDSPIIAAIKDDMGLKKCLSSDSRIIFVLYGNIVNIADIVEEIKAAGKLAVVHIDLIQGLHNREIAVDFIHKSTKADGIISTKSNLISRARELHMFTVMRFFVIDSMAYSNMEHQIKTVHPDVIEILPALMPKVVKKITEFAHVPVIAGGLVSDKDDVMSVLSAGATCVSSSNQGVWFL